MFFGKFFRRRGARAGCGKRGREAVAKAAGPVAFENLEIRRLFTVHTWTVTAGHSTVYLQNTATPHQVQVRLDNPTTGTIDHTFTNTDGMDEIINSGSSRVFIDQVPAADEPTSDGTNDGIQVHVTSGTGGTLEIDGSGSNTKMELTASTSSAATVQITDGSDVANARFGTGVSHLLLVANNAGGAEIDATTAFLSSSSVLAIKTGSGTGNTINIGGGENSSITGVLVQIGAGSNTVNLDQDDDADGNTSASIDATAALGSGNVVNLGSRVSGVNCEADIAQYPGSSSHTVIVDTVNVHSGGTLMVNDQSTIGDIQVDNGADVTVSAPLTVASSTGTTGTFTVEGIGDIAAASTISTFTVDSSGNVLVEATTTITTCNVANSGDVDFAPSSTASTITTLNVSSSGQVYYEADLTGSSHVYQHVGTMNLSNSAYVDLLNYHDNGGENTILVLNSLSISDSAQLDINDNPVIYDYTGSSPLAAVRTYLANGRGGSGFGSPHAPWNGTDGIMSSYVNANGNQVDLAIGYGENSAMPIQTYTSFRGQTVDSTTILITYTRGADATLDGKVDNSDNTVVGTESGSPTSGQWYLGDFDYSGSCDNSDVTALGTLYNPTLPPLWTP